MTERLYYLDAYLAAFEATVLERADDGLRAVGIEAERVPDLVARDGRPTPEPADRPGGDQADGFAGKFGGGFGS